MKMKDMCASERPREKMMGLGPSGLSNGELLAILLRSGTTEESALDVARKLLGEAGGRLADLFNMTAERMRSVPGIGPCKAAEVMAAFELGKRFMEESTGISDKPLVSARAVYDLTAPRMKGLGHEEIRVLFLNRANRLMAQEQVGIGDSGSTVLDIPRILRHALEHRAAAVILIHNHPAGNPNPSSADLEMTKSLKNALNTIGISLLDHIIVSDCLFFSFADNRLYSP